MAKKRISAYTRNRNRIMSTIRRMKAKGFSSELYFPTEKELRSQGVKGKELTQLTRELKSWTSKSIKEYIISEDVTTFEPPFNPSDDTTFFDEVVINQWILKLNSFTQGEAQNLLKAWLSSMINENGKHNVAKMLNNGAEAGNILTWDIAYKVDQAVTYISNMLDYLPDQGVLYKEETLDRVEYMKRFGDALEQDEDWEEPV